MLRGKVALVTGGGRGIGAAVAIELAKNRANIAVIYAGNAEAANSVKVEAERYGVRASTYLCDVSNFRDSGETVRTVLREFGGVDILVNNAGITADRLLLQMSEEEFDRVIDVNLKGAFAMIRHLYGHFMKKRAGRIINISSVSGLTGNPGQANYSSAKAGMIGLTKTVAKELASRGITCNAIAPGFIETDMTAAMPEQVKESAGRSIPMGRMGTPEEIAYLAAFLASDMASYITGEVIRVDGGLAM